jgi:nucleobase:cation symporter-1, NCS1 family
MPAKGEHMAVDVDAEEVPRTLAEGPPPRLLGILDQTVLWGNLGISLLLVVAGTFVLAPDPTLPPLSIVAALTAVVVGAVIGNAMLGLAAVPGAETGAPAMVLVRGLLGRRGSWLPTVLNIAQNLGWAVVELVVVAELAGRITDDRLRPLFVIAAGATATFMAVRPLGVVRGYLRKVAVWAVVLSTAYLLFQVLRRPLPPVPNGSWSAFWKATDIVIALPISWAPLAADYSRHSRSGRAAFGGAFLGYGMATIAFFVLGVIATANATAGDDVLASLVAIPAGAIALLILLVDELDEVFANLYSTVVSAQNIGPRLDRRVGVAVVGAVATALALVVRDWVAYESFLLVLGSIFVPLFGALLADYFVLRRRSWDVSESAPARWEMVIPWVAGFLTYQLINPGVQATWRSFWVDRQADLGLSPPSWTSASLMSFLVAAVVALVVGQRGRPRHPRVGGAENTQA